MFSMFVEGSHDAINSNLRGIVFAVSLQYSKDPDVTFDHIMRVFKTDSSIDAKLAALSSIGATNSVKIVEKILETVVLDQEIVKPQDVMRPISSIANLSMMKPIVLDMLWVWFVKNWKVLHKQLATTLTLLGRVLETCVSSRIGDAFVGEVEAWASGGDCGTEEERALRLEETVATKRPLEQALERVRAQTSWVVRDTDGVLEWAGKL